MELTTFGTQLVTSGLMTTENKVKVGNHLDASDAALARSVTSLQSNLKNLEGSATSPVVLVPLARQLLDLARKSAAFPPAVLQASLMRLPDDVKQ
jgi:hypothetical protein